MRLGNRPLPCGQGVSPPSLPRNSFGSGPFAPFFALLSALVACQGTPDPSISPRPDAITALFALEAGPADPPPCSGWSDPVCDDGDPCTLQACIDGVCRYVSNQDPACCSSDADCDDGNPCTTETCSPDHSCIYKAVELAGCCTTHAECMPGGKWDDGDPCTLDFCQDHQCQHVQEPAACDCSGKVPCLPDSNPCTVDECACASGCPSSGKCTHTWIPGCCAQDKDCNDSNICTADTCQGGKCVFTPTFPTCCVIDLECADSNPCNLDKCVNHVCRYSPNPALPDCCDTDADCDDGIACTAEHCDQGMQTCVKSLVPGQVPPCCWTDAECDDEDPFTIEQCVKNQCSNQVPYCPCIGGNPCNDNNQCTTETCENCQCKYTPLPGCCTSDAGCDASILTEGKPCATAKCINYQCLSVTIPGCCDSDSVCGPGGKWDDGDLCSLDLCVAGRCRHLTNDPECCVLASDCDDNLVCTIDSCAANLCVHVADETNLSLDCCASNASCDDGKSYTLDKCVNHQCVHADMGVGDCDLMEPVACDDFNACTCDLCFGGMCRSVPQDVFDCGLPKDCCAKLSDCPPSTDPCVMTSCDQGKCLYDKQEPCAPMIPFVETFNPCSDLDVYWDRSQPEDGSGKWWSCAGKGALGPDPHAAFVPTGQVVGPVEALLATNTLSATGAGVVSMQWSWAFSHGDGSATLGAYLVGWNGGPVPQELKPLKEIVVDKDLPATHQQVQLPPDFEPTYFRVGFGVKAESSAAAKSFELDDVRICPGHPPEWNGDPGPQEIGLGEKWTVELSAWNAEAAEKLEVSFVGSAPSFAVLSAPMLDPASGEWSITLSLAPSQPKDVDEYALIVRVSDGCLLDDIQVAVVVFGP